MVIQWLSSDYEIPFTQVPTKFLFALNNKSCYVILQFLRKELKRQVKCGILSVVPCRLLIFNPIFFVFINKWRLVVDCRLLIPYVVNRMIMLADFSCVTAMLSIGDIYHLTILNKDIGKYF